MIFSSPLSKHILVTLAFSSSLIFSEISEARVFDMSRETFGSYLIGGLSSVTAGHAMYQNASAADTYEDGVNSMTSGDFGFFRSSQFMTIRFGLEVIVPKAVKDAKATQGGVVQYTITSKGTIYLPKIGLDLNLHSGTYHRLYVTGSAGYAKADYKNDYKDVIAAVGDHGVEFSSTSQLIFAGAGVEFYTMDTTTILLEAGYRSLVFRDFRYSKGATTFSGDVNTGDVVKDINESTRTVGYSGIVASVGFRFYF